MAHHHTSYLFGYGSLVWKPDIEYVQYIDGYVENYGRRFWQGSPDHRGTHERPGRVATLLTHDEIEAIVPGDSRLNERVWGRLYEIEDSVKDDMIAKLDHREKAGYDKILADVHCVDNQVRKAFVFRAIPCNDHFLGPVSDEQAAEHIAHSVGPSGANREYFENLVQALERLSDVVKEDCVDLHLKRIYKVLQKIPR